ncbi:hypothetical protein [Vibrio sp. CyArs1]|uniref:hypothetical protein n=1 Tax=Vibrio sp. CyArs1 TaxID=2682577 RepID=UPI001F05411A|nr:hypothetical protein [Vibrio sp. CyArs1]
MTEQQEKDLVVVIDDIMGGGKSTNTISGLRDMHNSGWLKDNPVVLITPFKDEVERFQQALGDVNFVSPTDEDDALYLEQFKEMAREGKHIITTHALYRLFDAEARDILRNNKYGLVMDEAVDVLEPVDIFDADIKFFLGTDVIKVEEERVSNGRTLQRVWKGSEEAPSKYRKDFSYFDSREHYLVDEFYGLDRDPKYHIIKALPRNLIEVFHGITILTYRFEHSLLRCILDLWERPYHMISATGEYRETDTSELRELITVEDNVKWNYWYQGIKSVKTKPKYHNRSTPSVLSSTWCKKNVSGAAGLEGLSKVVRNFCLPLGVRRMLVVRLVLRVCQK